ncbi:ethanolamine ammonia-lyase subunit EutC [Candidatus Binatia bacterium]|nr:ethanolamine ammonia-lyase subunit EutC [Candidatus Binatia bacterium]
MRAEPSVEALESVLVEHTPARVLVGEAGDAYRTATQLELRRDHAAARDAVRRELDLHADLGLDVVQRFGLFVVDSCCRDKDEYLLRPDLGRRLSAEAQDRIRGMCPPGADLQVVVGDGLSVAAVAAQAATVLGMLADAAAARGWTFGQPFCVRHCRVGVLNDVGDLLAPEVVVLLIGERPGLRYADSLSAYLAYQPRAGHTDAERNLVCNIHERGVAHDAAVARIVALAEQCRAARTSGIAVKEELSAVTAARSNEPGAPAPAPTIGRVG